MSHPFEHPASEKLLERVASHFKDRSTYLLPQNKLVFVCGGPVNQGSARSKFLKWARENISGFRFFLAESAAKDIISGAAPKFLNLAAFESVLADVADVVVIFPESVGSWAETGFFSALPQFQKKCLVVNCVTEQGDSFLNVGPIQTINESSDYRPVVFVNFGDEEIDFSHVVEKLKRYEHHNKIKVRVENFNAMTGQQQLAFVFYLIQIFPSLNLSGIHLLFKRICSRYKRARIAELLSILVSTDHVKRRGEDGALLVANRAIPSLFEIEGIAQNGLLSEHLDYFRQHAMPFIPDEEMVDAE
jgi:hypothetical protein